MFVTIGAAPISQAAFMSFTTPLTSSTVATGGTTIEQSGYSGVIQFNFVAAPTAASNILTVTFTGGLFSGTAGGNSAGLSATQPPGSVTYTSGIAGLLPPGLTSFNFGLSFSGLVNPLALSGTTVGNNAASVSGTFSATTAVIPEPASVVMASMSALVGLGCFGWRRLNASRA